MTWLLILFKSEYIFTVWPEIFYQKPWPHVSVYFIGLAFGYCVFKIRVNKLTKVELIKYFQNNRSQNYWLFNTFLQCFADNQTIDLDSNIVCIFDVYILYSILDIRKALQSMDICVHISDHKNNLGHKYGNNYLDVYYRKRRFC